MFTALSSILPSQQMTETTQIADITVKLDALHSAYAELLDQATKSLEDFEFTLREQDIKAIASEVLSNSTFKQRIISDVIAQIRRDLISFKSSKHDDIPHTYRVAIEMFAGHIGNNIDDLVIERMDKFITNFIASDHVRAKLDSAFRMPADVEDMKAKAALWDTMIDNLVQANLQLKPAVEEQVSEQKEE